MTPSTLDSIRGAATAEHASMHRTLVQKLSEIQLVVERIPKRGRNQHFAYDFATESDITAAIRKELASRHLMLVPDIKAVTYRDANTRSGIQTIARVDICFTIYDGESGESLSFNGCGEGQDSGDKCVPKGITSAVKFALLKLFLIPTGDDPEIDSKQPKVTRQRPAFTPVETPVKGPIAQAVERATSTTPAGYTTLLKYEKDRYGWHHVILAEPNGVEVKTKFDDNGDLEYAFKHHVPVKIAYNNKSYITKFELLKGEGGEEPDFEDPPPVTDDDEPPF